MGSLEHAHWDDDDIEDRIGLPVGRMAARKSPPEEPELIDDDESAFRPGESGLGVPQSGAVNPRPLSEEEVLAARRQIEEEREAGEAEELQLAGWGVLRIPAFARNLAAIFFLGSICVLTLFSASQAASLYANLRLMAEPVQWIVGSIVGIVLLSMLWVVARLARLYFNLRLSDELQLRASQALAEREALRTMAGTDSRAQEARALLEAYAAQYLDGRGREKSLLAAGLRHDEIARLKDEAFALVSAASEAGSGEWIDAFQLRFQSVLDGAAERRASQYARRAGLATGLSPRSLIDWMIILYAAMALLADLCVIYNLRMNRMNLALLLAQVAFNTYVAGVMQDATAGAADALLDPHHHASGAFDAAAGRAARIVGAKAGEAAVNFLLMRRLGRTASRMLRPTHPD